MSSVRILLVMCGMLVSGATLGAQQSAYPSNPHGVLPKGMDCSACHTSSGWKGMKSPSEFDHSTATKYPLTGRHVTASCARCHISLKFDEPKAAEATCSGCHVDVHRGSIAGTCTRCHNTTDFKDVEAVALHRRTGFPLVGAHLQAPCESCHRSDRNGAFTAVSRDCISCHRQVLATVTTVDHTSFPTDCSSCHVPFTWTGGTKFDHVTVSGGFVLAGQHAVQTCARCHTVPGFALRFAPPPNGNNDCVACHRPDYVRVHGTNGYPTTCADCHSVNGWSANFNHAQVANGFALIGAHNSRPCAACHTQPSNALKFTPPPTGQSDCVACHRPDYTRAHPTGGFPTTCTNCHTSNNWNATFNHATAANGFRLLGAHSTQACAACHTAPSNALKFVPPPTGENDCVACHRPDYTSAHGGQAYPTGCTSCHTVNNWNSTFNHDATEFRINSGKHRGKWTSCATCHIVPTDIKVFSCLTGCHGQSTTNNQHQGRNGYSYDSPSCLRCHSRV